MMTIQQTQDGVFRRHMDGRRIESRFWHYLGAILIY